MKSTRRGVPAGACACSTGWSPIITRIERRLARGDGSMRLLPLAFAVMAMFGAVAPASAEPALMGCDAFVEKLRAEARDLQVDFSHALIVSRAKSDSEVFDISTRAKVDETLTCRHESFARFEAHIAEPASARATTAFERFQAA